jgi:transposase
MLARLGAPVTRQSLTQGFHAWCALAEPLVDAMQRQIEQAEVVHVDGSFVFRQNRDRSRRCTRSPVYAVTDGDQVVLRWRPDERHATAADLLHDFQGFLIHDAWPGWRTLQRVIATHGGCNAHARRPFALVQDTDADAARMVSLYAQLFAIEAQARASGLTGQALIARRHDLRRAHSVAVMDAIEAFARDLIARRTGAIATAAQYILTHRDDLRRFLTDGRLPPDNNLAERVLRRNALLRRNRPFFVAEHGGTSLATALSVCGSCRLLRLNPLQYLMDCLPVLLAHRAATAGNATPPDLAVWTPAAYAARSAKTAAA